MPDGALPALAHGSGCIGRSMGAFEYIFTSDDCDGLVDAPRVIGATSIEDAIQILFLRELAERGIVGTLRVRRWLSHDPWIVWRYVPHR
jgi:hypothetical protein